MEILSFEDIMTANYNTMLRIAIQHTGSRPEAEDIVQETFLKLLESGRKFRNPEHAKAFLIRSTVNRCLDYLKSARHQRCLALTGLTENHLPAADGGIADDDTRAVLAAVGALRPEYRNVIYLFYFEEYSIREIAAILHKSSNTVSSWLTRARKQLKEVLQDEEDSLSERDAEDCSRRSRDPHEGSPNTGTI